MPYFTPLLLSLNIPVCNILLRFQEVSTDRHLEPATDALNYVFDDLTV